MVDSTFSRTQLQAYIDVKKGKVISNWNKRLCVVSGTRLLVYKGLMTISVVNTAFSSSCCYYLDKFKKGKASVLQLAKGSVTEVEEKGHSHVLKLSCSLEGEKVLLLSLPDQQTYNKWLRKCKKVTSPLLYTLR